MTQAQTFKYADAEKIKKTIDFNSLKEVDEESFKKVLSEKLQEIVDYINQPKIINLPEIGFYIDKPENGMIVYASGWTEIVSISNGLKRNSGFNPNFKPNHEVTTGSPGEGKGIWVFLQNQGSLGFWYQVTLGPARPIQ